MNVTRFRPEHLASLRLQPEQANLEILRPEYVEALAACHEAFTIMDGDAPIACLGVCEHHPGRAELWALLSGEGMRFITRVVRGWLLQTSYPRVDAVVSADFKAGHKWMRMLGFMQEGPVRRLYMPDGQDGQTYVYFRGD